MCVCKQPLFYGLVIFFASELRTQALAVVSKLFETSLQLKNLVRFYSRTVASFFMPQKTSARAVSGLPLLTYYLLSQSMR